jgi:hypothetical protein
VKRASPGASDVGADVVVQPATKIATATRRRIERGRIAFMNHHEDAIIKGRV